MKKLTLILFFLIQGITSSANPYCESSKTIQSKSIKSLSDYENYYNALKEYFLKDLMPFSDFKQKYINDTENEVSILGFEYKNSASGWYGNPYPKLGYFTEEVRNCYSGCPMSYNYNVWGIALSKQVINAKNTTITFNFGKNYMVGNISNYTEIDFGDGAGFQKITLSDTMSQNIKYYSFGIKTIKFKREVLARHCNGMPVYDTYIMEATLDLKPISYNEMGTLSASKVRGTGSNSATYKIYNGNDNVFNKPVIIVEGFDILRNKDPEMIHKSLGTSGIYETLTDKGFDIMIIQFNQNNDYIENNAQVLKEAFKKCKKLYPDRKAAVLGISMGGIIARVALKEMENAKEDHHVGTYLSYDSPHHGAEVPIGYQTLINDITNSSTVDNLSTIFGGSGAVRSAKSIKSQINSPAGKQLLINHYSDQTLHTEFQTKLDNLGFPTKCRNVSITCGNTNGNLLYSDFVPGEKLHSSKNGPNCWGRITTGVWSSKINTTNKVSELIKEFSCTKNTVSRSKYNGNVLMMIAPGGYIDLGGNLDGTFIKGRSQFSFVPINSSLAIKKSDGNYQNYLGKSINSTNGVVNPAKYIDVNNLINSKIIPFNAVYAPSYNTAHVDISSAYTDGGFKTSTIYNISNLNKVITKEIFDFEAPMVSVSTKGTSFEGSINITLSAKDDTDSAPIIYYTLDGTEPTTTSNKIVSSGNITISKTSTLKFYAVDTYSKVGVTQTEKYTLIIANNPPILQISPKGGNYSIAQKVVLSVSDDLDTNPTIYFTLDGTEPSIYSQSFAKQGTLTISNSTTLKAFAIDNSLKRSLTQTEIYTINTTDITAPTITVTPKGGNYLSEQNVTIIVKDNVDPSSIVYYTIDGSEPNVNSSYFINTGSLKISTNTTLKVWAKDTSGNNIGYIEKYTFSTPQTGVTVWFKKPANWATPKIHYWYDSPTAPSSAWPGVNMAQDLSKGADWYTFFIANVNYTHLLFHDGTTANKTPDQTYKTGGCFDGNTFSWISCDQVTPTNEFTVWFKSPWAGTPKIHYWNVTPYATPTKWPGVDMIVDYPNGSLWYKFTIKGSSSNLLFHNNAGNQTVDLFRNSNGCYDGYTKTWVNCGSNAAKISESVNESSSITTDEVVVTPNPTSDIATFEFLNPSNEIVSIQIINVNGQIVLSQTQSNIINMQTLPTGLYFYHVITKTKEFKGKIIKN